MTALKERIGTKTVDNGSKKYKAKPIEDVFSLASMVQYSMDGIEPGAYLLKKKEGVYQIKFGFECMGIHPVMRDESIEPTINALEAGLKDLPEHEDLTVHLSCFRGLGEREKELKDLIKNCQSPRLKYLLMSQLARLQELDSEGVRKNIKIYLYCTYTVGMEDKKKDPIASLLEQMETAWDSFVGQKEEKAIKHLAEILKLAYKNGYILWEQLLANKLGLPIRALNAQELWNNVWNRFNQSDSKPVPQYWYVTPSGAEEIIKSKIHPVTLLMESPSSVPVTDRQWLYLKDSYITASSLIEKPAGWPDCLAQIRYIWDSVFKDDRVFDTEVIFEMRRANQSILFQKMQSLTKQSIMAEKFASEQNTIDVHAGLKQKKAIDAQELLYEGSVSFKTALVFLVHRPTNELANAATSYLSSKFLRPAWLARETEYAWKIILDTFPIYLGKLHAKPFDRRLTYLNSEVPGLMPLVKNRSRDRSGFELIAAEGGTPMYIDFLSQHRNIFVLAKKRNGKSVMYGGMLLDALVRGIPVMAIDYPDSSGRGSFSSFSEFLGDAAAYFDIGDQCSNLFEMPDLKGHDSETQQEKLLEYFEYLVEVLLLMVMGLEGDSKVSRDTVRSLLVLAVKKFFYDPIIKDRYIEANTQGFGTQGWQNMPTLEDFEEYLGLERLELVDPTPEQIAALNHIKLRLRFWIASRVGKAIAGVSTFKTDAQFLCVAMRNLSNPEDAAVLSMVVFLIALRRGLSVVGSVFAVDEASVFCQYDSLAKMIAKIAAAGPKSKIRLFLASQEPNVVAASPYSPSILQNMDVRLIGKIDGSAIDSFEQILKIPRNLLTKNTTEGFGVHKSTLHTDWLLDYEGTYTHVRYFAPYALLAAMANNSDEAAEREEITRQYNDPISGMNAYSYYLVNKLRAN